MKEGLPGGLDATVHDLNVRDIYFNAFPARYKGQKIYIEEANICKPMFYFP